MLKKFFAFLAIALAVTLVLCWIYLPSISRYRELKSEEERLSQKIQEIDTQIKTLAEERNLLQTDVAYLEKVIREELGFVKPGEIVYELISKKHPSNQSLAVKGTSSVVNLQGMALPKKATESGKTTMSPMQAAVSLAQSTPKLYKKKTLSPSRSN